MRYSNNIIYTAGTTVSLFCQWLILMLIPKITDFSEAGIFAVALSICSILNVFATFSIHQYQISDQYHHYSQNEYKMARIWTIGFSFILCFGIVLFFNYSLEQSLVIIFYMIYRNFLNYAYVYTAAIQIRGRLDHVGLCTILEGIVSMVSFIVSYYLTQDLVLSVAIMAILGGGTFLFTVTNRYLRIVGRNIPAHRSGTGATISIIKIGIPLLLSIITPIIITALPKILLQAIDGNEIAGIFSTLSAPTIIVPTLIMGMFVPYIIYFSDVSRSGDLSLLRRKYANMVILTLSFGLLCYILSRLFGEFAFELLYGPSIIPYVRYFDILIVGITLYSIGMCGISVLITKEQGRAAAIMALLSLLSSIIIFTILIPEHGISGATYGLFASYGIFSILISIPVVFLPLTNVFKIKNDISY